ncbi:MAG: sulfatase [Phycisphaerae bacterium]
MRTARNHVLRNLLTGWIIASVGLASLASSPAALAAEPDRARPNILFILADQYRQDCVGTFGNRGIHTPNLDRLAKEGMRFDRAYAAQPVCSPNRGSILTGLYPHSHGVFENNVPLPKTSKAMSEMLAPRGYDCGYFGKWHLVRRDAFETFPEYPNDGRGNNHYYGKGESKRYGVDVITEDAIAFIRKQRSEPFYTYVSYYPPHPPFSVPEEYLERYKDVEDQEQRIYFAMCTKVDEAVGALMAALDEEKLAENTLVVFTSDHGHNFKRRWNDHHKRLCYDTSALLPLIMRMPGAIPAGRRTDGLISSVDLTPTILSLAGQPVPDGLEGQNLSDLARGKTQQGRRYVFIENIPYPFKPEQGNERCVFDGEWKLILSTKRAPELMNVKQDPAEKDNRYPSMKDSPVVRRLREQLAKWARETKDDLAPELLKALR